jgi:hypothetical protein
MASKPDEVPIFSSIYLVLPAELGQGVYSVSNRKKVPEAENFCREQSAAGA